MFIIQEFQNIMIIWYVQHLVCFKHFAICKIMMNYAMLYPVEFCIKTTFCVYDQNQVCSLPALGPQCT